ncbi:hypothetical protein Ancab_008723 [Ancistrocladus abbreviatus]
MVSDSLSNVLLATSAAALWHLWLAQHNWIFQKVLEEPGAVFYKAQVAAFCWLKQRSKLLQVMFTEWCLMSFNSRSTKDHRTGQRLGDPGPSNSWRAFPCLCVVVMRVQVRLLAEAPVLVAMVLLCGFLVEMV